MLAAIVGIVFPENAKFSTSKFVAQYLSEVEIMTLTAAVSRAVSLPHFVRDGWWQGYDLNPRDPRRPPPAASV